MTTTTNLPADADNVLANAGQAVIHTSETLIGDIVALFTGTTHGYVILAQVAAIVLAVFAGLVVHKIAGAHIKALTLRIGRKTWKAKALELCLNTINDILFSATAAALLSLCVWGITETGFLSDRSELVLVRVAYQIFYAWAILLVLMQFFTVLLGERMFGKGLRHAVRIAFWVLAILQIIDVLPVIPPVEEFPYAIRVVSEVVSSNGSTSQGSICGSTLALMDAGVPISAPVAGISCGLIQDDDGSFTTFIDIQGVEDFHGEMDFKVAGTKKGITAIQMDLKNDGLTMEIIKNALDITYDARCQILDQIMLPCIAEPRPEVSKYAPKMVTLHIDPDKIREVIGKGGSVIQKIVAESGAKIDIDDDGTIHIASPDAESCAIAKKCIDDIVFVPEVGQLYYGRVVRLMTFGAFVELAPGKDGLVHISKLADKRIEKVEDACKVGDMMWVKVTEIDEKGRVNLSHKDAMKEIRAKEAAGEIIK